LQKANEERRERLNHSPSVDQCYLTDQIELDHDPVPNIIDEHLNEHNVSINLSEDIQIQEPEQERCSGTFSYTKRQLPKVEVQLLLDELV